jgi:predicted phosphodiesterase
MRINIVSDIHDDIFGNRIERMPEVDCDVTVVAGDAMAPGTLALRRLRELYPDRDRPLIYIRGNHDVYSHYDKHRPELKTTWERQRAEMPQVAESLGIIFLDDGHVVIDGVRYVGSTLWTNFLARPAWMSFDDAVRTAARGLNDYKVVKVEPGRSRDMLRPRDTIGAHKASVAYIESTLAEPFDGGDTTVLITHHPVSVQSLRGYDPAHPERFSELDWCYASAGLDKWFTGVGMPDGYVPPALALHGHVHENRDYTIGHTRIVANPRGYPLRNGLRENPNFNPGLVIEVERRLVPGMSI